MTVLPTASFDRNLNTGGRIGWESEDKAVVADQTVHCSVAFKSHLLLPVIPLSSRGQDGSQSRL